MDEYQKIPMFDLVKRSDVDESKHTIYRTLWAYKIKFEEGGLVFSKLNPRWCVKGGTMDRDVFKSYAEMMRSSSMNIGWGLKSAFYDHSSSTPSLTSATPSRAPPPWTKTATS